MGKGSFGWIIEAKGFYKSSNTLDIYLIGISEQHYNLDNSKYYLFGSLDMYSSDQPTNTKEEFRKKFILNAIGIDTDTPLTQTYPNGYEINGVDLNMGVGYDVLKFDKGFLGLGFISGVSLPFLNSDNPLRIFATDPNSNAITYKFGLSLQGKRNLSKNIWLYSTLFYAYQIGSIENSKEASSLDIEGAYRFLDLGIKVNKISDLINPKISFSLGYNNKHWAMDNIDVKVSSFDISKVSSLLSNNLSSDYIYFSFGYEF